MSRREIEKARAEYKNTHPAPATPDPGGMLEALKLADAALSGANMNMKVVERKVRAAIALLSPDTTPVGRGESAQSQLIATAIENKAREIYDDWEGLSGWVPWVPNGNSIQQDEARRLAAAVLKAPREEAND